jgi:hypothetical protein
MFERKDIEAHARATKALFSVPFAAHSVVARIESQFQQTKTGRRSRGESH